MSWPVSKKVVERNRGEIPRRVENNKKKTTNNGLVKQCVVISVAAIIAHACPRCSAVIAGGEKMKGSGALEGERKMENDNGLLGSSWVHAGPSYHPWGWPNYSSV